MNEVRRAVRTAAKRLLVIDLIRAFIVTLSVAMAAMIALRLVQQVFGLVLTADHWYTAAGIAAAAAALGATVWCLVVRRAQIAVARELDDRAGLRESLSTALCVERTDDPWCRAVVETAQERARRVIVRDAIPIESPRFWPVPLALALSFVVIWFAFPRIDVLGMFARHEQDEAQHREVQQVKATVADDQKKLDEILKKANVEVTPDKPEGNEAENAKPMDADELRRAAIKKLTSMQDKLNELKGGEKAQKMQAMRDAMKQLKQPGPGPLDQMAKALQAGNFKQAQESLEELSKKLADDSLNPDQKEQLKQQLAKLSEQLNKVAEDRKNLEQQLKQAGMDQQAAQKLAADPEALKKALEQMKNLSEEQKQQLMEAAKAASEACKQCSGMGQKMGQMAAGMSQQGMDSKGQEGMEGMMGMLSEMEMMKGELDSLDAAMSECSGQLAKLGEGLCRGDGQCQSLVAMTKPWQAGDSRNKGKGQGGPGMGEGGEGHAEEAPTTTEKVKGNVKQGDGPIIGSRLVQGDVVKGEASAEWSAVVEAATEESAEAIDSQVVPREYHDAIKTYFGRLAAKTKTTTAPAK